VHDILFSAATSTSSAQDKAVFCAFLLFTFICFSASSAYHTYRSHSISMYKIFLLFDVGSIAIQIGGSVLLIAYFEMSCDSSLRHKWISGLLGLFLIIVVTVPYLIRHRLYNIRTFLLTVFALSGLAAHFHRLALKGLVYSPTDSFIFRHLIVTYACPGIGLVIRRTKIPELFFPGKFDIWFSSHQIFHTLTLFGPWAVYTAYRPFLLGNSVCN